MLYLDSIYLSPIKTTASGEIEYLSTIFDMFGNPFEIVSDRAITFISCKFANYNIFAIHKRDIKYRLVAIVAPWNG